jgi:hypothetical protein
MAPAIIYDTHPEMINFPHFKINLHSHSVGRGDKFAKKKKEEKLLQFSRADDDDADADEASFSSRSLRHRHHHHHHHRLTRCQR